VMNRTVRNTSPTFTTEGSTEYSSQRSAEIYK
jgi:hypothetical protein